MNFSKFPDSPISPARPEAMSDSDVCLRFSHYLRHVRTEAGVSQMDLSISLGRGPKYIWRVEHGHSNITLHEFVEIVKAFHMDPVQALDNVLKMRF